jgi:uncharacterized protein (DUF2141 family)
MFQSKRSKSPRAPVAAATALAAALSLMAGVAQAANVDVHVTGVSDPRGHVRVELCTRDTFLTNSCPYAAAAPAMMGDTVVQIEAPPGVYAVQAYHDDTDAGHIHQNLLGIPRERVGFSNDAPLHIKGPAFQEASFVVGDGVRKVTLRLRRVLGGKD